MTDTNRFTAVFECDIRVFPTNPLDAKTPFGYAVRCGIGDAFNDVDNAEDEITRLRALLDDAEKALVSQRNITAFLLKGYDGNPERDPHIEQALKAIKQYKEEKENGIFK